MSEYELWNEIGNLYFLSGAYPSAIQAYTKAIELDSGFGLPYSNLALVYVQQGQYERAIDLYRRSIELLSDSREKSISWNRLGTVYRQIKDYNKAVAAYQKADDLNPEPHDDQDQPGRDTDVPLMISMPLFNLASPLDEQSPSLDKVTRASVPDRQQSMDQTVVISPPMEFPLPTMEISSGAASSLLNQPLLVVAADDSENEISRSGVDSCADPTEESLLTHENGRFPLLLEDQEDGHPDLQVMKIIPDQMIEEGKPILQASFQVPENGSVDILEPYLLREFRDEGREVAVFPPKELDPDPEEESDLGKPLPVPAIETDLSNTVANDVDVIAYAPDLPQPADGLHSMDEEDSAHESALALLPEDKYIVPEVGISDLKKIVDLNPHNAIAWDALGSQFKNNGQYQEAIFAYEHAISIETNNASFHYHLGLVFAATNRNEDALRLFKKVINLDPDYGLAHATLSGYYRRMGLEELARQHINKALNNTFQNENEYNRACLESICGNSDRALEYLELALQKQQSYADWALRDPDLDFVRNDTRFMTLVSRYATSTKNDNAKSYCKMQIGCS